MKISNDIVELLSETTNTTSPKFKKIKDELDNDSSKSIEHVKKFITSIESIAVKDKRISDSTGNIEKFSAYKTIEDAISIISTIPNTSSSETFKNLKMIFSSLKNFSNEYSSGYDNQVRLIILEYETSVYMLVTGLTFLITENTYGIQNNKIQIVRNNNTSNNIISSLVKDLAKKLSDKDHKKYLFSLSKIKNDIPINESILYTEGVVGDSIELITAIIGGGQALVSFTFNVVRTIRQNLFGMIPLIKSMMYLWYKKKADHIGSLESQINFLKINIDQLKNIKGMDEEKKQEIIKKQTAVIEAYNKKVAKLRAQLIENEKETTTALKTNTTTNTDDDLVLD